MVLLLIMTLFLAVVSISLWTYSRALLTSAAAQAVRSASSYGADATAASQRAADMMRDSLAGDTADSVHCVIPPAAHSLMVELHCSMEPPLGLTLLGGIAPTIHVTAHALRESEP